jgi:hypothetical protein
MRGRSNGVLVVGFIAFFLFGNFNGRAQTPSEKNATALLFSRFETVVYTSTEIPSGFDAPNSDEAILRYPFVELLAGLKTLDPNTVTDIERGYSPILVGAKDFVRPEGLGPVSSHDCYVGLLKGGQQPNLEADFRKARSELIEGKQAWAWEIPPYEGHPYPTTFYFTQVAGSYFVMANNQQDFREVLNELTPTESSKTVPVSIPGWNTFSAYKYWAYRSIRRSGVADSQAAALTNLPGTVGALAFFADIGARQSYFQVYSSGETMKTVPKDLPVSALVHFQPREPGVWQAAIPLLMKKTANNALFQVFFYLGFGVAL